MNKKVCAKKATNTAGLKNILRIFLIVYLIEQLLKIVKGTIIETPVLITCYYGLRRSEILGLKWKNINFNENTLTIKDTRVFYNKEIKKDYILIKTRNISKTWPKSLMRAFR
ncbi:MAG: hypothetical protein Q8942_12630 [Bacillota bacterium]|nr:hypothetical protein [Bacillota bacterium]